VLYYIRLRKEPGRHRIALFFDRNCSIALAILLKSGIISANQGQKRVPADTANVREQGTVLADRRNMAKYLCDDIVKTKETQRVGTIVTVREDEDKDLYLVEFDRDSSTRTFFPENELDFVSRPVSEASPGLYPDRPITG
jgi:hypothetical protein